MNNLFFVKFEIFIFFVCFFYIIYYIWERIYFTYFKIKEIVIPKKVELPKIKNIWVENIGDELNLSKKDLKKWWFKDTIVLKNKNKLSEEDKQRIAEIIKKVKNHITKWYYDSARLAIIEGLSLAKFNKELNLSLAYIYEKESKFKNAEFIYRDLIEILLNDYEIKKKLAFNLAMQKNYEESITIYEEIHKDRKSDNEVVEMLTDLTFNMWKLKKCNKYVSLFLKENPRNVEKLFIKWLCLEHIEKPNEAILIYKKILQLQPYNTDARDKVKKLES